ncbi:MAG: hypothetical protein ACRYF2_15455 [Janthinobacterium lividum]
MTTSSGLSRSTFLTGAPVPGRVGANFPTRRPGTAADVGHAAVFLMTNPYVTGTVLEVSGSELLVDRIFCPHVQTGRVARHPATIFKA